MARDMKLKYRLPLPRAPNTMPVISPFLLGKNSHAHTKPHKYPIPIPVPKGTQNRRWNVNKLSNRDPTKMPARPTRAEVRRTLG